MLRIAPRLGSITLMDSDEKKQRHSHDPQTWRRYEDTRLFFVERILCAMRSALNRHGQKTSTAGGVSGEGSSWGYSHTDLPDRVWKHVRAGIQLLAESVRVTIELSKPYHLVSGVVRVEFTARTGKREEYLALGLCVECGDPLPGPPTKNGRGQRCKDCIPPPTDRKLWSLASRAPIRKRRVAPPRQCVECGVTLDPSRAGPWKVCGAECRRQRKRNYENARYPRKWITKERCCLWCKKKLPPWTHRLKGGGSRPVFCNDTCRKAKKGKRLVKG